MFPTFIESIEGAIFWKTAISFYVWMTLTYTKGISMINFFHSICDLPYGLAVRIPGFHPGGPGSTPGMGTRYLFHLAWLFLNMYFFYFTNSFKFFFRNFIMKITFSYQPFSNFRITSTNNLMCREWGSSRQFIYSTYTTKQDSSKFSWGALCG